MSSQSIDLQTISRFREESEDIIIYNFENYFYDLNFKIGKGIEEEELEHYSEMYKIMNRGTCEIVNYIQDKIEGRLQPCIRRKISDTFKDCEKEEKIIIINTKHYWEQVLW